MSDASMRSLAIRPPKCDPHVLVRMNQLFGRMLSQAVSEFDLPVEVLHYFLLKQLNNTMSAMSQFVEENVVDEEQE